MPTAVDKLKKLLDDPHPGLFAWRSSVMELMDEIGFIAGIQDIPYNSDFKREDQCQVIVRCHGETKEDVLKVFEEIVSSLKSQYGKPLQGTSIRSGSTTSVYTPIWNGKEY
jgi:hypothetical protein